MDVGVGVSVTMPHPPAAGGGVSNLALIESMLASTADGEWALAADSAFNATNLGSDWLDEATFVAAVSSSGTADNVTGAGKPPYDDGPAQVLEAWNGMAIDTVGGALYHYGGGHSSYTGNEVYKRDLSTGALTRLCDPTVIRDPRDESSPSTTLGHGMELSGGQPTGPLAGHTYHALHFKDGILYMMASSPYSTAGVSTYIWGFGNNWQTGYGGDGKQQHSLWKFDTTAESPVWERMADFATFGTTASTHPTIVDHPTDSDLLVIMTYNLTYQYKISTGAFQDFGSGKGLATGAAPTVWASTVDVANERIYALTSKADATYGGFCVIDASAAWAFGNWKTTALMSPATFQSTIASIFSRTAPTTTQIDEMGCQWDSDAGTRALIMLDSGHLAQMITDGTVGGTSLEGFVTTGDVPTNQYGAGNRCVGKLKYIPDAKISGGALVYADQRGLYAMRPPAQADAGWA